MHYKLRAECANDVLRALPAFEYSLKRTRLETSVEFTEFCFETDLNQDEIINILKTDEDGHVMWQTLQPVDIFSGERNYDL